MNEIAKRASGLAGGLRQRLQALRGKRQKQLQRSARLRVRTTLVEGLEQRLPLTAYLFVDYGDNFPAGVLSTTQGAFRDVADSPNPGDKILGTQLLDASDNFNAGTQLDIVAQSFTAQERADMLEIVSRAFRPIDMEVVELTSSPLTLADGRTVAAATTMNDVINTLRGGSASAKDAYVFVATFIVDPGGADEKTYGPGGGGLSPDSPTLGVNSDLVDAANNHDDVAVVYSDGGFSLNTANNIAHEAGHLLGLQHSITDATNQANVNLFHQLEIMSYQNTNDTSSSAFTRFPMIRGDDNSPSSGNLVDYNDLAARNGQTTIYDQLAADPNVGPNPNFTFITGTGAHDIITISRNGAVADVTIEAFGDAAYTSAITVPGEGDNVYSYSIPLTRPILVYAGGSDDRVVIKGDLGVDVEIDGMLGTDSLVVDAQGAANVQHRPNPDRSHWS
ncbi:MAG: hypothetical protein KatS3mg111_1959 [Pirellulaceae bacterium]|nr:MAG: hypothetical protein KatS3mg111_1959 [Pirellulaceae bacterium]